MSKWRSFLLAVFWIQSLSAVQPEKPKDEGWSELLPPGEGKAMVLDVCTDCHNLKGPVHERKNRAGWTKTLNDMIQKGAPLYADEVEPLANYLTKVFGPDVPKPVNVNTATHEELEKLPNLKPETATRLLELRQKAVPFKNAQELREALGKQADDFEKYRYLLKYKD